MALELKQHRMLFKKLRQPGKTLAHPACSRLLEAYLRDENLPHIPWESAWEVIRAAECFYGHGDGISPPMSRTDGRATW